MEGGVVLVADIPPVPAALGVDAPGDIPPVEGLGVGLADGLQRGGVVGKVHHLPGPRRPALRREGAEPGPIFRPRQRLGKAVKGPLPHGGEVGPTGIALRRVSDGGGQVFRKVQPPEAAAEGRPGPRGPGHGDRRPAPEGHPAVHGPAVGHDPVDGQQPRRRAAGVEAEELLILLGPHQGEGVGADAVGRGLHHGERRSRRHRRVHGVAAPAQDLQPRRRRLGAGAVHHAAPGVEGEALGGVSLSQGVEGKWIEVHGFSSSSCMYSSKIAAARSTT